MEPITSVDLSCSFSHPQNYAGAAPSSSEPFQFASSTCVVEHASGTPAIVPVFTGGEIVVSVLSWLMIVFIFAAGFVLWIKGIKIRQ